MTPPIRQPSATGMATRTAVTLFLFVVVFTGLVAAIYQLTKPALDASAAEEKMRKIDEVLPRNEYDNNLLQDTLKLPPTPALGLDDESTLYRARRNGQPAALVFETVAPDGYAGRIRLIIALRADASVAGVRVTEHKETPGLGDYIEPKKDKNQSRPWITQFNGLSPLTTAAEAWKVKKDGGQFDYYAGATVTPRAVVKAVKNAVFYVAQNRDRLFAPTEAGAKP